MNIEFKISRVREYYYYTIKINSQKIHILRPDFFKAYPKYRWPDVNPTENYIRRMR
jgi:hypothetical protein